MEELGEASEGEATPLPETFVADEEVDVFTLEVHGLSSRPTISDMIALVDRHRHSSLLNLIG